MKQEGNNNMCDTEVEVDLAERRVPGFRGDVKLDKMMGQVPRTWNTMLRTEVLYGRR